MLTSHLNKNYNEDFNPWLLNEDEPKDDTEVLLIDEEYNEDVLFLLIFNKLNLLRKLVNNLVCNNLLSSGLDALRLVRFLLSSSN